VKDEFLIPLPAFLSLSADIQMFAFLMMPVTFFSLFVDIEMLVESFVLHPTFFWPGADI
jgi:hypothetical protein